MITIHIDTTQGIFVTIDEDDGIDDGFTKKLIQEVGRAAEQAYNRCMGIEEVFH